MKTYRPSAPDPIPDHQKFGYQHMVEMNAIREELRAAGVTDTAKLHFAAVDRYITRHKGDPTYRETSERLLHNARMMQKPSRTAAYEAALREIAAGHNDARALAILVLGDHA